ncbi:MAG TPA: hypothetical protein VK814_08605 [Acidobacteriaceae bacterium]|nr:hypothetical protein [Acidobacteriaceae bacterium]
MGLGLWVGMVGLGVALVGAAAWGQASAVPSVQVSQGDEAGRGRELMDGMVAALGGEAWRNRQTWIVYGRVAKFYKGQADAGAPEFEEYGRMNPFALRVVVVAHYGALIATDHRDVAQVWTGDRGYEVTYKGATALGAKEVADFERAREHSLDLVVREWLREKDVEVRYEGAKLAESELVDEVRVERESGDAVTVMLDARTHLPVSVVWRWRDVEFKDWNTDAVEFADYHPVQGIMTPYSVTTRHNGDRASERFVTKVVYNVALGAEFFDPSKGLEKKK